MLIKRISSKMKKQELERISAENNIILLDPKKVKSIEELKLAEHLAKGQSKKIANKFPLEFLLWLSGKKDIKSAMKMMFEKNSDFIAVYFSDEIKLGKVKKLKLKKKAEPSALERISLSRI